MTQCTQISPLFIPTVAKALYSATYQDWSMLPSKPIPQTVAHRQYATTPEAYNASTLETVYQISTYVIVCRKYKNLK